MLTRINKHRDEAGFTLIELLVVVIIIGILAAIAIPVFLNQRASAQNASIQSDMRNAAIEVETFYTQQQSYPDDADALKAAGTVIIMSTDNQMGYTEVTDGFQLKGCNTNADKVYVYDSTTGGLNTAPVSGEDCDDVTADFTEGRNS